MEILIYLFSLAWYTIGFVVMIHYDVEPVREGYVVVVLLYNTVMLTCWPYYVWKELK